jgi:hypothetical protein
LNGIDSFAVCEDNSSLDKKLNDFTIEAWIYPKRKPERDEWWIIAAKPGSYELAFIGPNDRLQSQSVEEFGILFRVHFDDPNMPGLSTKVVAQKGQKSFPVNFNLNEWHHIATVFLKQKGWLEIHVDGIHVSTGLSGIAPGIPDTPSAFYVGGTDDSTGEYFAGCRKRAYFDGCIDDLRISNTTRPIIKIGRVDVDRYTQALWYFDEPEGAISFQDSSGKGNTLVGKGRAFPVESTGKLTTTLAIIKKMSFLNY